MRYLAESISHLPAARLAAVVTDVASVAVWNDALTAVHTTDTVAVCGERYRVKVKRFITGWICYETISPNLITYSLSAAGNVEHGSWAFAESQDGLTRIAHEMFHTGPVLRLMTVAFDPVPGWRIARLEARTSELLRQA